MSEDPNLDAWADNSRNGEAVQRALIWFRENKFGDAKCRVAVPRTLDTLTTALQPHCVFVESALPHDVLEWLQVAQVVTIDRSERSAGKSEVFYDLSAASRLQPPPFPVFEPERRIANGKGEVTNVPPGGAVMHRTRPKGNASLSARNIEVRALVQAKRAALTFIRSREHDPESLPPTYHELLHTLTQFCDLQYSIPARGVVDSLVRKGFVAADSNGFIRFDQPRLQEHFEFAEKDDRRRDRARFALCSLTLLALLGPIFVLLWRRS